jgi:flagellar hook-length control protein FliK
MHPELGRVQVEVHTDQGRVDVELLARSLSASIALRASEPELRGDLRQRGASLRNYRVRTASDEAARALDERQR